MSLTICTNDWVGGYIFWTAFLNFCKQHQERVFHVEEGLELQREQLTFPVGQWSKKNGVKVLDKREKQDSGVWKRETKKLKPNQNKKVS